ncbi:MAG: hypothetical protein II951_03230 [Bacteroidales bacterium]|nr:hypothetical protein [Bacteroidales bacterium]
MGKLLRALSAVVVLMVMIVGEAKGQELTLSKEGDGDGSIEFTGGNFVGQTTINYDPEIAYDYTFKVTPAEGSRFVGLYRYKNGTECPLDITNNSRFVSDNGDGKFFPDYVVFLYDENCSYGTGGVNSPAATTIKARFELIKYSVSVATGIEHGTVEVKQTTAAAGQQVIVDVKPDKGYEYERLTVNGVEQAVGVESFEMPKENVTISATFKAIDYSITFEKTGKGRLEIGKTSGWNYGNTIYFQLVPEKGYKVNSVSVVDKDGVDVELTFEQGDTTFVMPASDVVMTAEFGPKAYTITKASMTNGDVSVANTADFESEVEVTPAPVTGYELDKLTVTTKSGAAVTCSGNKFTMPADNVTVSATFKEAKYAITTVQPTGGSVSVDRTEATLWDWVIVTCTPDVGYELDYITINGSESEVAKFMPPGGPAEVSAVFKKIDYEVTNEDGYAKNLKVQTANYGNTVRFEVEAKDGFRTEVTVRDEDENAVECTQEEDGQYKFTMPASNVSISVEYISTQFTVDASETEIVYSAEAQGPSLTVRDAANPDKILVEGDDYTVSGVRETNVGTYRATVTGKTGTQYEGCEKTVAYEIEAATATVTIGSLEDVVYSGAELKQETAISVSVVGLKGNLVEGVDYEVAKTYPGDDYTNVGTKKVSVLLTSKNVNYVLSEESKELTYEIEPATLSTESSDFELRLSEAEVTYDMEEHEQTVTAKFNGTDLTANDVTIEGDLKAREPGTHKITLTGKGNFTGSVELTWTIAATEYTVALPAATESGSVVVDKEKAILGEEVTLTVEENVGYRLTTLAASYGDGIAIDITEDGNFLMPDGDVTVRVEFEKETYPITVTYDEELGEVNCPTEKMWGETVEVSAEAKEGYEVAHIYISIDGEMLDESETSFEMPMDKEVDVMVVFRKELKAAVPVEDKESGEVTVVAETTEALAEIIGAVNDTKSDYYEGASIVLTSDIDGGEAGKQEIDLEEQNHETMTEKAIELPTIETLKGSIEGQGNVIKNVIAQMAGLVKTVEEEAEVNTLVMDSTTIYIDPTDEAWTVKDDTIFVHIVAKSNKGNINNFAFAGKVVVDESKVPEGRTVVVCIVGENEGTVNGFFYDFDLLEGNVEGNKRCITIKQNIGCAKNGGRAKVATSKAANNKTLNVGTYDDAEVNKMERAFTAKEFASGEVAYWLNWSEQGYTGEYRPIWRQGKNYPELAIDIDGEVNALYKIDYVVNEPEKIAENPVFANNGDKVTIKYTEKPVSIKNGDQEIEIGEESATFVYNANKSIEIEFAETTGVRETAKEVVDEWHDMAGRKLSGKPSRNGVYVHNGKIERVK